MRIVASGLKFPEGPVAMRDGSVLVVEMARQTLSRVTADGEVEVIARIPGGPNGAAIGPDGRVYIANNGGFSWTENGMGPMPIGPSKDYKGGGIDIVDLESGKVERLYDSCDGRPLKGPNDLVFDEHGGFYFSDPGKRRDRDMDRGFVYYARADGSGIHEVISQTTTPNGVGLSPDNKTFYLAETETARIVKWDVIGPGQFKIRPWPARMGGTLIAGLSRDYRFDSLAVTDAGNICVAALDACCVVEISPDGALVRSHPIPDTMVTNLCFGGPDMRTAFVTLSHRGQLLATTWPERGLILNNQGNEPQ
jgi:gluconolactonase